jgi:hypothetical protein
LGFDIDVVLIGTRHDSHADAIRDGKRFPIPWDELAKLGITREMADWMTVGCSEEHAQW